MHPPISSSIHQPGTELRPTVRGKFLFVENEKLYVRGVTYGPFRPDASGSEYHHPAMAEQDFAQLAAHGINAIRTYTVPPRWLLDLACQYGLWVMVGLPWEQHIAFLDEGDRPALIEERVRTGVRSCAGHPAVLCYAIGNEIPAPIVRWHGRRRIERFLERLYRAAKAEDPTGLVTYVNYPTTEYLHLPFVDLVCFNVYLESTDRLAAYLARLQNLAGHRPLIMGEIGLDSLTHGEAGQAAGLAAQIRTVFDAGCVGGFVFAWTDEWHRGGFDVENWGFGLTHRDRRPKPSLAAVRTAFAEVPFRTDVPWPRISVVVCSYNGARHIRDCLESLRRLDYPDFEVIVVDDGSTDGTAAIAREYGFRVIRLEQNGGLSNARNVGLQAATGSIVAYVDDDAWPDPHWLSYLAAAFRDSAHAGVGGPNIPPPGDGPIAECVANAPGGPVQVLLSDQVAEHIPGCNMAFRRDALLAIGGFDRRFRVAGDDVDICWRLQERGWTIGFSPAAVVWHHRRNSVRSFWRQQLEYGKAEALLEQKWPEKYNAIGHVSWAGRIYGNGLTRALGLRRNRVYHGLWGSAPFQSLEQTEPGLLGTLLSMPECYLVVGVLLALGALGIAWRPLVLALPLAGLALAALVVQAGLSAAHASFSPKSRRFWQYLLTALLHLLQPLARLTGRLRHGLTPWRWSGLFGPFAHPWPQTITIWSERWSSPYDWLRAIETAVRARRTPIRRGSEYERWDLMVGGGLLGVARLRMVVEEHGGGRQQVRFRICPSCLALGLALPVVFGGLSLAAALDGALVASAVLAGVALLVALRAAQESAVAMTPLVAAVDRLRQEGLQPEALEPTPTLPQSPAKPAELSEPAVASVAAALPLEPHASDRSPDRQPVSLSAGHPNRLSQVSVLVEETDE